MKTEITTRQLHILQHALGLDRPAREYRNHYCPGGDDLAECEAMEAMGLMTSRELSWVPDKTYFVSDAGRDIARLLSDPTRGRASAQRQAVG